MKGNLNNKRKGRAEKGITLVALVVTVVVLLILAGVSIVTLFGESGIIKKAQTAKDETERGVTGETTGISDLEKDMNTALGIVPETTKGEMVDKGTKVAKYVENGKTAYIPGGYGVVADSSTDTDEARKVNKIANGLVISDLANDTLDNEPINGKRGNQFVWVPVPDITSMYGTNEDGKQYGKIYSYGTKSSPKNPPEALTYSKGGNMTEPDVVTKASGGGTTTGGSYDGDVANLNIITDFTVKEGQTKTAELFKNYLQDEFDSMISSVKKYGGFYIGRYETGDLSKTRVVVQKGNNDIVGVNWYNIYQRTKNIEADNSNVTASMIWGCQWDRTLNWLIETPNNGITIDEIVDSTTWGNHSDNTEEGHGSKQASGYKLSWQKNHIYDMAGNVQEWTVEIIFNDSRVVRGGKYDSSGSFFSASSLYPNIRTTDSLL